MPACRSVASPQHAWLPFAKLNLLRNPFGQLTPEDRAVAAIVDVDSLVPLLEAPKAALQVIGECGRGKSTHLHALLAKFPQGAYVYLPEERRTLAIPHGGPLFIDEAQRLPWLARRAVFRRGVPLVLGTHRDLTRPLMRAGYHVNTVDVSLSITSRLLHSIFNRRIELARLAQSEIPTIGVDQVDSLMQAYGDDIRAMEQHLYDHFQAMVVATPSTLERT